MAQALPPHLAAVRRMFEESHLFIFTVGLTEIWESTVDGAVFPVAPGWSRCRRTRPGTGS